MLKAYVTSEVLGIFCVTKKWVVANGIDDEAALRRQNKNPDEYMSQTVHVVCLYPPSPLSQLMFNISTNVHVC